MSPTIPVVRKFQKRLKNKDAPLFFIEPQKSGAIKFGANKSRTPRSSKWQTRIARTKYYNFFFLWRLPPCLYSFRVNDLPIETFTFEMTPFLAKKKTKKKKKRTRTEESTRVSAAKRTTRPPTSTPPFPSIIIETRRKRRIKGVLVGKKKRRQKEPRVQKMRMSNVSKMARIEKFANF